MIPQLQSWRDLQETLLKTAVNRPRFGLVTDVDGTISPIVDDPDAARVTPRHLQALRRLQADLPLVAVISGRAATDVRDRVGLPGLVYVGNHGLERWEDGRLHVLPAVREHRSALRAAKAAIGAVQEAGMWVEDKEATLSVHYRGTVAPAETAVRFAPILQAIADEHGLRLFSGRMIFELRPPLQANKGTAFTWLVETFHLDSALFIGDDTTDVDALQAAAALRQSGRCHTVGVGVLSADMPASLRAAADCFAADVDDVAALLDWLSIARSASRT